MNSSWNLRPGNCIYLTEFGMGGDGFWTHGYLCLECTPHLSTGSSDLSSALPWLLVSLYLLRAPLDPTLIAST